MAVNSKDLTVDYKTIQAMPFRDRRALMYSSYADQINAALTPSQRANLFPSYYRQEAEAAQSAMTGVTNLSKAEYLNRARNNAGVGYGDTNKVAGTPEEKGPPKITASEFRAVESNPFLAGYVDKTTKKEKFKLGTGQQKLLELIASGEGGYNSSNRGTLRGKIIGSTHQTVRNGKPITDMTVAEIMKYQSIKNPNDPNRLFAVGKYQLIPETFSEAAKFLDLKPNDKLTPEIQEKLGMYLISEKRPAVGKYLRGESDDILAAQKELALEFASIPVPTDMSVEGNFRPAGASAYGSGNRAAHSIEEVKNALITARNEKENSEQQKTADQTNQQPNAMTVVQQVAQETVSASEIRGQEYESLGKFEHADSSEQFGVTGTAAARGLSEVDPRLVDIMKKTAEEFPLRTRLFSGKRDKGGHGAGVATDIQLFDEDGKPIGSYQTPQSANIYAMYALKAREVQMRDYPELKDSFTWLGGLGGMTEGGGGKYGAADWMDFRIGHTPQSAMVAFKWPDPDEPGSGGWQKGYEHYTEGDFTGIGHNMPQAEDFKKLEGLVLTPEQEHQQRYVAERIGANAGLLAQPNIGKRRKEDPVYVEAKPTSVPSEKITVISSAEESSPSATMSTPDQRRQELGIGEDVTGTGLVTTSQDPEVYKKESRASALGIASAPTATETPKSETVPVKTMAQGGIINPIGDSEIVTRSPTTGEVTQVTKVAEYGAEQIKIEPMSKMNADALSPDRNMPPAPEQEAMPTQQEQPAQVASMTSSKVPAVSYSNIESQVRRPTSTALRAAMQIRMVNTDRSDYIA